MKGTNLGEFEELVMLTVAVLYDDAYGLAIQDDLKSRCNRKASLSTIHVVLHRLEKKGFLESRLASETSKRGGRRKLIFCLTKHGINALQTSKDMRNDLWLEIPEKVFGIGV